MVSGRNPRTQRQAKGKRGFLVVTSLCRCVTGLRPWNLVWSECVHPPTTWRSAFVPRKDRNTWSFLHFRCLRSHHNMLAVDGQCSPMQQTQMVLCFPPSVIGHLAVAMNTSVIIPERMPFIINTSFMRTNFAPFCSTSVLKR